MECYKCHKKGHYKRDFPLWIKKGKEKSENSSSSISVIIKSLSAKLLVFSSGKNTLFITYTMDSSCFHYYSPYK